MRPPRGLGPRVAGLHDINRRRSGEIGHDRTDNPGDVPSHSCLAHAWVHASMGRAAGPWNATPWDRNLTTERERVSLQNAGGPALGTGLVHIPPGTLGLNLACRFR